MSVEVLESYLVSLGAKIDEPSFAQFEGVLHRVEATTGSAVGGMVGDMLKFQFAATSAFAAVGFGAIAYIDKLAMADQQQRLFAQRSFLTIEQARSVQTALSALGATADEVAWDSELHRRFTTLIEDQRQLSAMLGSDYEKQLKDVRDVRFELSRLEVKGEYFGRIVAGDILKKLGFGDGSILQQLEKLNDFVMKNLPAWADELSTDLVPVLKDFWMILTDLGHLAGDLGLEFTNLIGVLSGDNSIQGSTFDFHKFAEAVEKVAHWMAVLVHYMLKVEQFLVRFAPLLLGAGGGGALGGAIGTVIGGIGGIAGGPLGILAGAAAGGAAGTAIGTGAGAIAGGVVMGKEEWDRYHAGPAAAAGQVIDSSGGGVDPRIVEAVGYIESRNRQTDKYGNVITSNKGALGRMQLMPATAAGLGVNPYDEKQNVEGGSRLLGLLAAKYGNWDNALAAYNWGEKNVDTALRKGKPFPSSVRDYAHDVEQRAGITVGSISVVVSQSNAQPHEILSAVKDGVKSGLDEHNQRTTIQNSGAYN